MDRAIRTSIVEDLRRKMVFLSGPRQVGKTTLARRVLEEMSPRDEVYLNWDRPEHRKIIRDLTWSRSGPVAVLDEVHKFRGWKTLVKGFHDTEGAVQRLLVTGSARLDVYRRGGDSLAGRYASFRLHPLTMGELGREGRPPEAEAILDPARWPIEREVPATVGDALLTLGGFPEPFLGGSEKTARRWRLTRREQVLHQDVRDLALVRDISGIEHLLDLVTERVSLPLSLNSLREDLSVDHKTIRRWLEILERLQVVFFVRPFAGRLARTLRKESKVYFWDWSEVLGDGARFENMVASHLLKLCHWIEDVEGYRMDLRYVRDREKKEVDFLLLREKKPWVLVEAKVSDLHPAATLSYFRERLGVPFAFQVVGGRDAAKDVIPASRFFSCMP